MADEVGPHAFRPLGGKLARFLWRLRGRHERCLYCYLPPEQHPTGWTATRPIGDYRENLTDVP